MPRFAPVISSDLPVILMMVSFVVDTGMPGGSTARGARFREMERRLVVKVVGRKSTRQRRFLVRHGVSKTRDVVTGRFAVTECTKAGSQDADPTERGRGSS